MSIRLPFGLYFAKHVGTAPMPSGFEILDGRFDRDSVVSLDFALDISNTWSHGMLGHDSCRPWGGNDGADSTPQRINVLSLDSEYFETVSLECLCHVEALQIFRRMSDGNIIVVNE